MTSQSASASPGGAAATGPVLPAGERGATVIPEKVVARIAARAAREALATHTATSAARAKLAAPHASVTVGSGTARLGLRLDLPYPLDLTRASRQVQQYVSERVAQLTGMRVTEVTLAIEHLVPSGGLEDRRVQ
ncbi:Asp23/Gls24 family envelope stress response protein [Streptomyces yangpuensis]|uniref:Asp23/Gls24 family envelope stress response protein n=1 Tax=Streptomyces TaxID=1883 RepID=UPI000690077D|nr:Asp23/Gls24 family envelope stress response protein [Streptomyces sp. NRRL S-378]